MRVKMVLVKNVSRLSTAGHALLERAPGMPGMGLIEGETGAGKTTAVTWWTNQVTGVYVRAMAMWSPSTMLTAILRELDATPASGSCGRMVEQVVEALALSGRPLILDEADYIVDAKRMIETLRDLHDMASVPVILVGMAGIRRKISLRQQLSGRIAQWVDFKPCDIEDARKLAKELCEVTVADDLLARLAKAAAGSVRLIVVGLARIEHSAKARGLDVIRSSDWGPGGSFFLGDAPKSGNTSKLRVVEATA
jgi:DNA transposition AAA+ family ATPase